MVYYIFILAFGEVLASWKPSSLTYIMDSLQFCFSQSILPLNIMKNIAPKPVITDMIIAKIISFASDLLLGGLLIK